MRVIVFPDAAKIGFPFRAFIALDVENNLVSHVMDELLNHKEVKWLTATSGRFNIMAEVWFASADDFFKYLATKVSKLEGLKNTETFVFLRVEKDF